MKRIAITLVLLLLTLSRIYGWGFFGHKLVNQHAVFLLPPEMMILYKPSLDYLVEHSVDPDKRRYSVDDEAPRHYLDIDHYGIEKFEEKYMTWQQACDIFTEDTLRKHGIVPWWIQTMLYRLTEAFRLQNKARILKLSAELGHYIGDAHVPLHASSNHNGQHTGQHGIHGFWESRVPELLAEREWDFWIGRAQYIKKPLDFIWRRVIESAKAADTVLLLERQLNAKFPASGKYAYENRNGILVKQYSESYTREYDKILAGMVERRFRQSVYAVASFWYTAWVNAGQPDCSKIVGVPGSGDDEKDVELLNSRWKEGQARGKSCD